MISPYSNGNASSDVRNSVSDRTSGVAIRFRCHRAEGARTSRSGKAQAADERQARERCRRVSLDVRTVGDNGSKPVAEDALKVGDEPERR